MRTLLASTLFAAALFSANDAGACGCFTPPDPSVPVVQAGERILFSMQDGQVTAHIQIQYQGNAADFGWLLPLPSVPTLELGVDEVFTQLTTTTQPKYKLTRVYEGICSFDPSKQRGGVLAGTPGAGGGGSSGDNSTTDPSPLVYQDSIGPYDYAVLRADSQDAMLQWLSDNRYFVPAGTDDKVGPYIHPGAYFLALKLHSGNGVGDLQPVVVHYASDLPMIPLVLTSVAANPHMGIQVWMLGAGRAIPRNYYHTVINDAKLDWLNGAQNYNDVIIAATAEAPRKHSFVTEYAGSSSVMTNLLDRQGRFGTMDDLAAQPTDWQFVQRMLANGFPLTAQTIAVLQKYIPVPPKLNVPPQFFYPQIAYYLSPSFRQQNPSAFAGWTENFQPAQMAADLWQRVVTPTLAAGALVRAAPYLTRLYTTLSPEDMDADPVFSYNPGLKGYANVHEGTLTYHCGIFGDEGVFKTPATLRTESGWVLSYPNGTGQTSGGGVGNFVSPAGPSSQRIEVLRETGAPEVIVDNRGSISHALGTGGCGVSVGARASRNVVGLFGFVGLAALLLLRRRRAA